MTIEAKTLEKIENSLKKLPSNIEFEGMNNDIPTLKNIVKLGDVCRVECAAMFTDVAGFTKMVERNDLDFAVWFLRAYLICIEAVISDHRGTISAFEGDGILSIFTGEDRIVSAVRCAVAINAALEQTMEPIMHKTFPRTHEKIINIVGIDESHTLAVKTNIWEHYDIAWVGSSINNSANMTRTLVRKSAVIISESVHHEIVRKKLLNEIKWRKNKNKYISQSFEANLSLCNS